MPLCLVGCNNPTKTTDLRQQQEDEIASSVVEPAATSQNTLLPPGQEAGAFIPLQRVNSVSASGGEASLSDVPLRRKTSMGSFQKGMGESLTGRLRKQLDIPREPKSEVNLNIPIDEIQGLKYLAQVIEMMLSTDCISSRSCFFIKVILANMIEIAEFQPTLSQVPSRSP